MNTMVWQRLSVAAAAKGVMLFIALLALPGCAEDGPALLPSPVSVTSEATPTLAPLPEFTATAPLPIATPSPTMTPQPTPCQFPVLPTFTPAYLDIELGCPIGPGRAGLATAYAPFEGGQMLWRADNAVIYVLTNDGRWAQYDDLWQEGDPTFTCGEPSNPPTPVRGFGRVWCDQGEVREALGAATAAEIGDADGSAQDFVNGMLLAAPDGSTFVLIGETATWRRVWPDE